MGLLLSVLVACVGVLELLTFYSNVTRNLTQPPIQGDLSAVRENYLGELYRLRKRIENDLLKLKNEPSTSALVKENRLRNLHRPIPTFRLNSHEDIEIECNQRIVARSRSSSPRRFLVTQKEENEPGCSASSPRRFVVAEEPQGLRKSKCQSSIPEFLIHEEQDHNKSPHHPRYVLKEPEGTAGAPIPLPSQFLVTENELIKFVAGPSKINYDDQAGSNCHQVNRGNDELFRRSPSPYPPLEIPHVPRNSICNDLVASLGEVDEELYTSRSPTPTSASKDNSEEFEVYVGCTNFKSPSPCPVINNDLLQHLERKESRSEPEPGSDVLPRLACVVNDTANSTIEDERKQSYSSVEVLEEFDEENATYDEQYLNSLDGVTKQKSLKKGGSSRRSIRKKTSASNSLDHTSNTEDSVKVEATAKVLVDAVEELKKLSPAEVAGGSQKPETENKTPEPFWLIFSGEYTKAMNKDWHGQHFCCWQCDESLTGQRYVLRDDHPYCVSCYESVFANACEKCSRTIGIDSKDLSYKDKHWHEACFLCTTCGESLVDKQFGSKGDRIYCGSCYDQQFASRCDGCHEIFRAGTKKMEYKTRQWHEKCFCCNVCKVPIGTQSFIPREQEIYCAKCYEEKFATRCIKCNKVITSGGVTYKNEPWHRECFTCTNCQKSLAGERFTSRDEKPFCAECFGELFAKRCTACNKPITGIGGTKFISFEDRHWHNDCFFCASCRTSLVGRGFITDQDDIICPECAKQKLM